MSRINWGILIAAIVGLTIYVFQAGVGVGYLGQQTESYPRYKNADDNIARTNPAPGLNVHASEYKQPCNNPQGHDESDLCAQWRAANNAGEAARWSFWQLVLSVFGVVGLGVTLALTIRATNAAVRSNEISQSNMRHQMRPYVVPGKVRTKHERGGIWTATMRIRNDGFTPTGIIEANLSATYHDFPIPAHAETKTPTFPAPPMVFSHVSKEGWARMTIPFMLSPDQLVNIEEHRAGVLFYGQLSYKPFADWETETVTFALMAVANDLDSGRPRIVPDWAYEKPDEEDPQEPGPDEAT